MKVLLIDNGSTLLGKLEAILPEGEIVKKWQDILPDDRDADVIVVGGSSELCAKYDADKLTNEIDLIRNAKGVVIGICLGAELIAEAYGGELRELPKREKGVKKIRVISKDSIFNNEKELEVYEGHRWSVVSLPDSFEIMATSEDGIEIFKHKEKPIFGLQFHPENLTGKSFGHEVFLNLLNRAENESTQ